MKLVWLICLFFASNAVALDYGLNTVPSERKNPNHAPRVRVISLSPSLDHQKPLGQSDFSGWTETGGLIVGAINENWVGGFSCYPLYWSV